MRQPDAMRFRRQPPGGAVAVEAPRTIRFGQFQPRFVVSVQNLLGNAAGRQAVGERHGVCAVPLRLHHGNGRIRAKAANDGVRRQVFKLHAKYAPSGASSSMGPQKAQEYVVVGAHCVLCLAG